MFTSPYVTPWRSSLKLLGGLLMLLVAQAASGEGLQYQVLYRGVFSIGSQIAIADVTLRSRHPGTQADYRESELVASSQAYDYVETFYPIRYRFRSWFAEDLSTGLAFEYYRQKRRSNIKHRLIYLDNPKQPFVTRDLVAEGELDLPALLDGSYRRVSSNAQEARFDRLALLQHVRAQDLSPGREFSVRVSNGKRMMDYRVSVEARELVQAAGRNWQALKVRFDGVRINELGHEEHAHRPIFIWFSDDPKHIPLRAVSRHTLGKFTIKLRKIVESPSQLARLQVG